MPTAVFHTLGCKLNFSETSAMRRLLAWAGYDCLPDSGGAAADNPVDVCVINTCAVTKEAERKCRNIISRCHRANPNAAIVVTGCMAQLKPNDAAQMEGVSLVLGNNQKLDLLKHLDALANNAAETARTVPVVVGEILKDTVFRPCHSQGDRTRSFLKIQDGCDYFCAYCTIPRARGLSRSGTVAQTVAEARKAAEAGAKEIILTGVNIGDFGRHSNETITQLAEALEEVDGVERFRISSIEPNLLTDELLRHVAQSRKFMPHFHVPLQSGCDATLKLMRRRYDTALFRGKIEAIRALLPDAFVGVDVITGVNGETPEMFEQTRQFVEGLSLSRLHVFTYSERPETPAVEFKPRTTVAERQKRTNALQEISVRKLDAFLKRHIGTVAKVLVEASQKGGVMYGFTPNYIKVQLPAQIGLANTVQNVRLKEVRGDYMTGEILT